jgi:hypothetical protein
MRRIGARAKEKVEEGQEGEEASQCLQLVVQLLILGQQRQRQRTWYDMWMLWHGGGGGVFAVVVVVIVVVVVVVVVVCLFFVRCYCFST